MRAASPVISSSFAACLLASASAHAIGFGRVANGTQLGQPLDFSAIVKLDADESLPRECVFAEVISGENHVAPPSVRVSVAGAPGDTERLVRVTTSAPIDEPVVTVNVTLGCTSKVTRQFVAFVDPPGLALAPMAAPAGIAAATSSSVDAMPAPEPRRAEAAVPRREASPRAATGRVAAAEPARRPPRQAPVRTAVPTGPRLQLDAPAIAVAVAPAPAPPVPVVTPVAAASAADDQADALARERRRIASLEEEMARLRADSAAQRQALAGLQLQVGTTRSQRYANPLVYTLAALCLLLTTVVCGLLGRRSRDRAAARWLTSTMLARSAAPAVGAPSPVPALPADNGRQAAAATATAAAAALPIPTIAAAAAPPAARAWSIEEVIDLEQQADFFVALGQDDAAVALLKAHVDGDGTSNPLPLLKLLEIHRRVGDRAEYDRVRARIDAAFNARTPEFETDPLRGRSLDDHPGVVARLQTIWPAAAQAREMLGALVFGKGTSVEPFDLPAFRELLFLHAIASDKLARPAVDLVAPALREPAAELGRTALPVAARPLDLDLTVAPRRTVSPRPPPAGQRLPVLTAAASQFDGTETVPSALRRPPDYANESAFVDLELEFPGLVVASTLPR